jgi:hypothetical protein
MALISTWADHSEDTPPRTAAEQLERRFSIKWTFAHLSFQRYLAAKAEVGMTGAPSGLSESSGLGWERKSG